MVSACWKSSIAAGMVGVSLLMSQAPALAQDRVIEEALSTEEVLQTESQRLQYMLQQQSLVKKAQIEAQRQQLLQQRSSLESALQLKITEQRASALAAKAKGDTTRYQELEAETARLEETGQKVKAAAAKIEAQLSRAEMLERARTVAGQQTIQRAVADAEFNINNAVDKELEAKLK